jgi:AraC-like DNA-binding protein
MRYWTTCDLPADEQFSYWREVICEAFAPLAADRRPIRRTADQWDISLPSWVRVAPVGSINCAEACSKAQTISHGKAELRRTSSEHVFVNFQLHGESITRQHGRTCHVRVGGFALVDTTDEYEIDLYEDDRIGEWSVLAFRIPRDRLTPMLANPTDFTAKAHDCAAGLPNVVSSLMKTMLSNSQTFDSDAAAVVENAFVTTLAAVASGEVSDHSDRNAIDDALRAAINRHIATNLRHADLSALKIARHFGISVRKLYKLYEDEERSYAQNVMALRVEGCARELVAEGNDRSLSEIATRWGFCDLSHLNRVFRAHYGCRPSEYREFGPPKVP